MFKIILALSFIFSLYANFIGFADINLDDQQAAYSQKIQNRIDQ